MIESRRINPQVQRNWLKAALQPTMLLYVFMIPALWIAVTAVLMLEPRRTLIFLSAAVILTILLITGFVAGFRHRIRLAERENLIAKQKLHLDAALANMPQGLCMFDRDLRLIVCNQQYADLYDLSKEQTRPGMHLKSILEHQLAIGNLEDSERYIAKGLSAALENRAYQITNRLRDGRLISVTHRPMDGGGWVSTHTDVTEQVRREESFRLLFESSPVSMWVIDRESLRFLAVNDAAIARYGYGREQFMSMSATDLRPKPDRERFGLFLRELEVDQLSKNVGQHLTSDGQVIDFSVYSRALTYDGHNARLTVVHDITKSKQAEDELRRTQKSWMPLSNPYRRRSWSKMSRTRTAMPLHALTR